MERYRLSLWNIPERKKGGYCVVVIGDKYKNFEWIPLGFGCMNEAQKVGFKLKSIIIKNMENNRGKLRAVYFYEKVKKSIFSFS